jgi:hypothetical protein
MAEDIIYYKEDPGYDTIVKIVGWKVKTLQLADGGVMFIRENGQNMCDINKTATDIFKIKIYGRIVIVGSNLHDSK